VNPTPTRESDIARLQTEVEYIKRQLQEVRDNMATAASVTKLERDIDDLVAASNRVKGAIIVVLAVGSLIGWLTTAFSTILRFFK
jgi:hypothetical protein